MKKIDMYAQPIQLSIKGNYNISSLVGSYLTILALLVMLAYTYFTGNDIYFRKAPKTYQEQIIKEISNNVSLSNIDIYFQVLFPGNKTAYIDPTLFSVKLAYKTYVNGIRVEKSIVPIELCSEKHFNISDPEFKSSTNQKNYNFYELLIERKYFCPSMPENRFLYGSWVEQNLTLLQILIYPCNNATDGVVCKSREEISNTIWNQRLQLSFMYPLLSVRLKDFFYPFSLSFKEEYYYLPQIDAYDFHIYEIEEIFIKTDYGYVFSQYTNDMEDNFVYKSYGHRNYIMEDPYFFSIDIQSSFNQIFYSRTYVNLSDIISNCGGFYANLSPVMTLIAGLFTQLQRTKMMIKSFFYYKDPKKQEAKINYADFQEFSKQFNNFYSKKNKIKNNKKASLLDNNDNGNNIEIEEINHDKQNYGYDNYDEVGDNNEYYDGINNKTKSFKSGRKLINSPQDKLYKKNKNILYSDKPGDDEIIKYENNLNLTKNHIKQNSSISKSHLEHDNSVGYIRKKTNERNNKTNKNFNNKNSFHDFPNIAKENIFNSGFSKIKPMHQDNEMHEIHRMKSINSNNRELRKGQYDPNSSQVNERKSTEKKLNSFNRTQESYNRKSIQSRSGLKHASEKNFLKSSNADKETHELNFYQLKKNYKLYQLLVSRLNRDTLNLSWSTQLRVVFCTCKCARPKMGTMQYKLETMMKKYDEQVESYFDYLNILKTYEQTKILIKILLSKHQRNLVNILENQVTPEGYNPNNFSTDDESEDSSYGMKSFISIIYNLNSERNLENRIITKRPNVKINDNLLKFMRKLQMP